MRKADEGAGVFMEWSQKDYFLTKFFRLNADHARCECGMAQATHSVPRFDRFARN
jgi:hypothetical protein